MSNSVNRLKCFCPSTQLDRRPPQFNLLVFAGDPPHVPPRNPAYTPQWGCCTSLEILLELYFLI